MFSDEATSHSFRLNITHETEISESRLTFEIKLVTQVAFGTNVKTSPCFVDWI